MLAAGCRTERELGRVSKCQHALVQLEGVVMGQQRMDINLTSLIATLREEARPPIGAIQLGD